MPVYRSNLCGSAIVINPDITNKRLKEKKATQPSTRHPVTICFTFYPNFNYMLHLWWQQSDLLHREVSYAEARKTCSMSKGKRGGGVNCCDPVKLYFPFLSWSYWMATAEGVGWRHLQGEHEEVQKRWKHVSVDTSCKKKQTLKTVLTVSSGVKHQLRVGLNVGQFSKFDTRDNRQNRR